MLAGESQFFRTRYHQREVWQEHDTFQCWHLLRVYLLGDIITYKEGFSTRVVDDIMNLFGVEFVKNRYYHGSVGQGCQEGHGPVGRVTSADGNLVTFLNATVLKDDVKFFYFTGYVVKLQRLSLKISQGISVPVVDDGVVNILVEANI